jgi:hypothetical protein
MSLLLFFNLCEGGGRVRISIANLNQFVITIDLLQKSGLIPPTPLLKGGFKEFGKMSNSEQDARTSIIAGIP